MLLRHLTRSTFMVEHLNRMTTRNAYLLEFKRFKHKKKWAMNLKEKTHAEKALEHFDTFYTPVYGNLWPSIRVALLSEQKYCALLNNFSQDPNASRTIQDLGANDIIEMARLNILKEDANNSRITTCNSESSHDVSMGTQDVSQSAVEINNPRLHIRKNSASDNTMENTHWHQHEQDGLKANTVDNQPSQPTSHPSQSGQPWSSTTSHPQSVDSLSDPLCLNPEINLDDFMPVEKVYSKYELRQQDIVKKSVFEPRDIQADTVSCAEFGLPDDLRVFAFKKGSVCDFPSPKPDKQGILGYYLLDAASILPIIALDLQPNDIVLDLCAAPGGKTLAMLQFMVPENINCIDKSLSRLRRLREVLRWYHPQGTDVTIVQRDSRKLCETLYTKVLVDVPCNTDRHVLLDNDNNLFKPSRISERLQMPAVQKELLLAGIRSCKPGGSVVYSTCTLSPAQNDGVIQAAIEEIWQETSMDIVIQDLSWIAAKFQKTFKFYDQCRHGQLVLPSLTSNFGPMYFSKITRLS